MNMLHAENLSCGYARSPIVHDINIGIEPGELTVLLGPNGSGKTTLIRGMTRTLKPISGSVYFDSNNIWNLPPRIYAKRVAYVSQFLETTWPFTVYEFIAMGRYPYSGIIPVTDIHKDSAIRNAMDETGLLQFENRLISELSGGELQRVMIARALAQNTAILILDEPVAHLDLHFKVSILRELKRICSAGKGVLISLHDLNLAAQFADKIYLMHKGSILASGLPSQVINEKLISTVYETPVQVLEVNGRLAVLPE